jgi:hypothetical protein
MFNCLSQILAASLVDLSALHQFSCNLTHYCGDKHDCLECRAIKLSIVMQYNPGLVAQRDSHF